MKKTKLTVIGAFITASLLALAGGAPLHAQDANKSPHGEKLTVISKVYHLEHPAFDGGDGPDYVNAPFDGGDGPDYLKMPFDGGDGPDFDGGDGPDYVKAPFDGGDGPDYLKMPFDGGDGPDFDGGDGPDYAKAPFDGGDGPDYLHSLVGSDAADSLVGSDAADSLVGSDAADSLVGSDAADSIFRNIFVSISVIEQGQDIRLLHELAAGLDRMLFWTLEDPGHSSTSSLKTNGNEVAFVPFAERWESWSGARSFEKESPAAFEVGEWANDFEALALLHDAGVISTEEFAGEVGILVDDIWWLNGIAVDGIEIKPTR